MTPVEIVTRMHYDHGTATEADLVLELDIDYYEQAALDCADGRRPAAMLDGYAKHAASLIAERRPEIVAALAAASEQRG